MFSRIGILGAGRAGTALARAAQRANIDVQIASTRTPRQMHYHLVQYAPQATPVLAEHIGDGVELVILAVPQEDFEDVDGKWFKNNILVDITNTWHNEPTPKEIEEALGKGLSSSEAVANYFSHPSVVKTLNHISHRDMDNINPDDSRAIGIAADNEDIALKVADFVEALGFVPVTTHSLHDGRRLEPDSPMFNMAVTPQQLASHLDQSI